MARIETITARETTLTLVPMHPAELAEWDFVTEELRGVGPVRGFTAYEADGDEVGVVLQRGRAVHAEWVDRFEAGEYVFAGEGRTLRQGVARILDARDAAGRALEAVSRRHVAAYMERRAVRLAA